MRASVAAILVWVAAGCSSDVTPIEGCDETFGIVPVCAFRNPEDLALLADGRTLLISQMASQDVTGSLVTYDTISGRITGRFPDPGLVDRRDWGDPDCEPPVPAQFAPQGIDLVRRGDGALAVLVINHGGPETMEFFAVSDDGALTWRGCVEGPADAFWNDVVGSADGGFFATQMMPKSRQGWSLIVAAFGFDTGRVDRWTPAGGFAPVPGTDMPFPNGIERSADDRYLFVGSYTGGELRKIDLEAGTVVGRLEFPRPDNLTWASDGRLLQAGGIDTLTETLTCGRGVVGGGCGAAFEVVAVDPDSMRGELVLAHRGAPMGGVSVALEVEGELFLGAFTGDRIARWRWRAP